MTSKDKKSDNDLGAQKGDLVADVPSSDSAVNAESERFKSEVDASLAETEKSALALEPNKADAGKAWGSARKIVEKFEPVPWFVWRIANFVLGKSGHTGVVPQGMLLGLRRLLFAAASDPVLGTGEPVNNMKVALSVLRSDVIAAVSVIHAISRRLRSFSELERIWVPILDDAILRSQIGYLIGERNTDFGRGRGMLAGFAGRAGLAVTIATGGASAATKALERLAAGEDVADVGYSLYGCDPLQVSAMLLSGSGCGRDAAFGVASFSVRVGNEALMSESAQLWSAIFTAIEGARMGTIEAVSDENWNKVGYQEQDLRFQLSEVVKLLVREGSSWSWLA